MQAYRTGVRVQIATCLRIAIVAAAATGWLVREGLRVHYFYRSGGWEIVWQQLTWGLPGTIFILLMGIAWYAAPYIVIATGQLSLKAIAPLSVLLACTFGLIGLDVWWYTTGNSKDWYLALAPALLTPIAGGCFIFALLIEKMGRPTSPPIAQSDTVAQGNPQRREP